TVVQAYRFASNEYRLFPIRLQMNVCQAFEEDVTGLQELSHCGNLTGCPLLKNVPMYACNWRPNAARFPPFIPNGKYMLELQGLFRTEEICLLRAYGVVHRPIVKK
ncbi:hypothetical protein ILUMI_14517, partial [Ignelater luminosus]